MLTTADLAVLNEAYRNTKAGLEAINTVISKVYDEDLALDLNRQAVRFLTLEDKVTDKIREGSRRPEAGVSGGKGSALDFDAGQHASEHQHGASGRSDDSGKREGNHRFDEGCEGE